ncbi:hypothetical protein BH23ACT7_BH23ACT7_01730 [soil metagenome]
MTEPGEGMRTGTTALSDRIAACLRAGDEEIGGPGMALHDAGGGVSRGPVRLTAAIARDGDWYVAQCLEVDVASQGQSIADARANLIEALLLYFEDADVEVGESPLIEPIEIAV